MKHTTFLHEFNRALENCYYAYE